MPRCSISWLITDTHWHHEAMVRLCGRPVDYGEQLLRNLKRVMAAQDVLYHLGDVILYQYPTLKDKLDRLPGTKILLQGNHDRKTRGWYMRNGFAFVADAIVLGDILLSHKPMEHFPSGVRLNIHGHWHNDNHHKRPEWYSDSTHRLLSVEATNYHPVNLMEFAN